MTAEQYVVKITYQTPPYANTVDSNFVFYVSRNEDFVTSPLLMNARMYDAIKNAKAAIAQRMRYAYYFKGAKFEIANVEVTVNELNIVTE